MERAFKAKEEMIFNLVDDNGFTIEEDGFVFSKDSVWYWDDEVLTSRVVRLLSEDLMQWLEVDKDDLEIMFKQIE